MQLSGSYKWIVLAACFLLLFGTVGIPSAVFSIHLPLMKSDYGLSNTQCSLILTIRSICSLSFLPLVDRYLAKIGMRRGITLGAMTVTAGFAIYAVARSFPVFCLGAAVTGIGFTMSGIVAVTSFINRWFDEHKEFAMGICVTGTGLAIVLMPPVITGVVHAFGLTAVFAMEAGLILAVGIIFYVLVRERPELSGDEAEGDRMRNRHVPHDSPMDAGREPHQRAMFLLLAAACTLSAASYGAVPNISLLYTQAGYSLRQISLLLMINGAVIMLFKFLYGVMADRAGIRKADHIFYLCVISGVLCCTRADHGGIGTAVLAMILLGAGLSLCTVGLSAFALVLSDGEDYGKYAKWIQLAYAIGTVVISPLGGIAADTTGSFCEAYLLFVLPLVASYFCAICGIRLAEGVTEKKQPF